MTTLPFLADPIDLVDRGLAPTDLEFSSFLVAGLSYGRVEQILKSCAALFELLKSAGVPNRGQALHSYLACVDEKSFARMQALLAPWRHRMNTGNDIFFLLKAFRKLARTESSLCRLFQKGYSDDAKIQISNFCGELAALTKSPPARSGGPWKGTGAQWFFCSPEGGGTSKRLMMWLRWMVRKDARDFGLWTTKGFFSSEYPAPHPSRLFMPVDAHIFKWARAQGIVTSKSPTWNSVEAITAHFLKKRPEDPVFFDFELAHEGMSRVRSLKETRQTQGVNLKARSFR